jgi:hypothetical protein
MVAHRVGPVIRPVRRKPLMQCRDERWVLRGVPNLRAIGEGRVLNPEMPSPGLQRG